MKGKKLVLFLVSACLVLILAVLPLMAACAKPVAPAEHEPYALEFYANRPGVSAYVVCFALGDLINKHSTWLSCSTIETKGTVENLATLIAHPEKEKIWLGHGNPSSRHQAKIGLAPFEQPYDETRALGMMNLASESFMTLDPSIKTITDLVGKNTMIAIEGTAPARTYEYILQAAGIWDQVNISRGGQGDSKNAIVDGLVDAGWLALNPIKQLPNGTWEGIPTPGAMELMETKVAYWVDTPPELIYKAAQDTGWPIRPITNAAGSVGKSSWEPWTGDSVDNGFYVHQSMPDDVVTEIMRILWEYAPEFVNYHAVGATVTHENLPKHGEPESVYHPAAVKFYKEKGVTEIGLQ